MQSFLQSVFQKIDATTKIFRHRTIRMHMSAIPTVSGNIPTESLPKGHDLFCRTCFTAIIQEYLGEEAPNLDQYTRSFDLLSRRVVHLNDPNELKTYVGEKHLKAALEVVRPHLGRKGILLFDYEKKLTQGYSFSLYPEILARAMDLARNKIAVELAGAFGENGMLLAFAGAERVYMNDCNPKQMARFQEIVQTLPLDIQAKLDSDEGDCLELLKRKPALQERVSVILCRNLIQFFSDTQMGTFFSLLKNLLEPGGRAILTVKSIYDVPDQQALFQAHPLVNLFAHVRCVLKEPNQSPTNLFVDLAPIESPLSTMEPNVAVVYSREIGAEWRSFPKELEKFPPPICKAVQEAFRKHQSVVKTDIKSVKSGIVQLEEASTRVFSKENLATLVRDHGFIVESLFVTSMQGHLVEDADLFTQGSHVGVIIQKPLGKKI